MTTTLARQAGFRPAKSAVAAVTTAMRTPLGWIAVQFAGELITQLKFGHVGQRSALAALSARVSSGNMPLNETQIEIKQRLIDFTQGEVTDLSDIEVAPQWQTPFACRVVEVCRGIPYGETLSYGEVAAIAGSPGAARAVGNVMSSNLVPLVIPCHRVVGAQGGLGGYSARGGVAVKQRLLDLEQAGLLRQRS